MVKNTLLGVFFLTLLPVSAFSQANTTVDGINCEERLRDLNDRYAALYIDLDSQCYPEGIILGCGFEISEKCQDLYNALSKQSTEDYDAFAAVCPDYLVSTNGASDSASPEVVQQAPSKKKMLGQIQGLKKKLKAEKKKNRNLRAQSGCR